MGAFSWIQANLGTIVAGAAVALIVLFALRNMWKRRKTGGCGCGCDGCAGYAGCAGINGPNHSSEKDNQKNTRASQGDSRPHSFR